MCVEINKFTNVSCFSEAVKMQHEAYLREKACRIGPRRCYYLYLLDIHACPRFFERPPCITSKNILFIKVKKITGLSRVSPKENDALVAGQLDTNA